MAIKTIKLNKQKAEQQTEQTAVTRQQVLNELASKYISKRQNDKLKATSKRIAKIKDTFENSISVAIKNNNKEVVKTIDLNATDKKVFATLSDSLLFDSFAVEDKTLLMDIYNKDINRNVVSFYKEE